MLSWDVSPALDPLGDLGEPDLSTSWLEPWIGRSDDPAEIAARRETVSLAFLAALQRLPPNQRAVLILRDVLDFSAADTAAALETSVASVTSALQRARATLAVPTEVGDAAAGPDEERVVEQFVAAFEAADVEGIVSLLAKDVRFTMPPLRAWFDGVRDVGAFFSHRSLVTPWTVRRRLTVNGRPALLADQRTADGWRPGALMVLTVQEGRIVWIASFLDPAILAHGDFSTDR
jgi:RNA polymerase sigma-70 factor (ECF subfamily)